MDAILLKYHTEDKDYLIYDIRKNRMQLDERMMRMICSRNFGLGTEGILVGPLNSRNGIGMKLYLPDGREAQQEENDLEVSGQYLSDAGYCSPQENAAGRSYMTGKIFLPGEFMGKIAVSA